MGCRKYFNGFLLVFVCLFLALFVGMVFDEDSDIGMKVFCAIMAAMNACFVWKLGRQVFGKDTVTENVQRNAAPAIPVTPEMDHIDDMSVQYNPYFEDVYDEQRRQRQMMLEQQQMQDQYVEQQLHQVQPLTQPQLQAGQSGNGRQSAMQADVQAEPSGEGQSAMQAEMLAKQAEEMRAQAEELARQAEELRKQQ